MDGIKHLTDEQLAGTWSWMQLTIPPDAPFGIAMKEEVDRRGLKVDPKPLTFPEFEKTRKIK